MKRERKRREKEKREREERRRRGRREEQRKKNGQAAVRPTAQPQPGCRTAAGADGPSGWHQQVPRSHEENENDRNTNASHEHGAADAA